MYFLLKRKVGWPAAAALWNPPLFLAGSACMLCRRAAAEASTPAPPANDEAPGLSIPRRRTS